MKSEGISSGLFVLFSSFLKFIATKKDNPWKFVST